MSWDSIPLGDIALKRGGSVDPKKYPDEVFELHSIPAFDAGVPEITSGSEIGSSKKSVQPNDVMISRIVPHIRRAWVVGRSNGHRQIASGEWIIFRDENIWPRYLRWVLVGDQFHAAFMRTVSGVGGSLLRARPAEVFKIQIPFPPLAEQKRIAAILDAADALRAKRRESLVQLDTLLQSTFLDIFGDPVRGDEYLFADLAASGRGTFSNGPFGSDLLTSELINEGVPVVYIRDIRGGEYRRVSRVCVTERKAKELDACQVVPGDVLIAKVGDPPGVAAIYPQGEPLGIITQDVIRIRPNSNLVSPTFLTIFLNSHAGKHLIGRITVEATRSRFGLRDLKGLCMRIPPLDLQHRFAAIFESIEQQKTSQRFHRAELDTLFASLQSRAFRGVL